MDLIQKYKMKTDTRTRNRGGDKRIPVLFDKDDFEDMINAIENCRDYPRDLYWSSWMRARDKAILAFMFETGTRPKEFCSLRFDDYRPKENAFLIRRTNNKENKDYMVALTDLVLNYLKEYMKFGRKNKDYIFPSHNNLSKPLSPGRWKHIMREKILKPSNHYIACKPHEMPRTRSYSFRASFATKLLMDTHCPDVVMKRLGHSDWRSLKKYVDLSHTKKEEFDLVRESRKVSSSPVI